MATCSSTLAWRIPWMEKPGGLQSMGLLRVRHESRLTATLSQDSHHDLCFLCTLSQSPLLFRWSL